MAKRGTIFGIFPVEIKENKEVKMTDCFVNKYFMWLFKFLNKMEALVCGFLGIEHRFVIKIKKDKN